MNDRDSSSDVDTWRVDYTTPGWQCPDCARGTCEATEAHQQLAKEQTP